MLLIYCRDRTKAGAIMVSCDTSNEITIREKKFLLQNIVKILSGIRFFYFCHWSPVGMLVLQECTIKTKRKLTEFRKKNQNPKI